MHKKLDITLRGRLDEENSELVIVSRSSALFVRRKSSFFRGKLFFLAKDASRPRTRASGLVAKPDHLVGRAVFTTEYQRESNAEIRSSL